MLRDALDRLVVLDNESDTLSSVDKGVPQLPEIGRLVARVPHLAPKDGHTSGIDADLIAELGFAVNDVPRSVLRRRCFLVKDFQKETGEHCQL